MVIPSDKPSSNDFSELPQYLNESGWCNGRRNVVVVVPRRMAAMTLAVRVAEEMATQIGDQVCGYFGSAHFTFFSQVGFATSDESRGTPNCRLRFVTDGVYV